MPYKNNSSNNNRLLLLLLQKWAVKTNQIAQKNRLSDSGLTLLEVLIGILIISVVVVASTPALILGVATRVQARRAEQAFNIAREEIEKIQFLVEQGDYQNSDLPKVASSTNETLDTQNTQSIINFSAPTSLCNPPANTSPLTFCEPNQFFKVFTNNPNNTNQQDYYLVQVFRSPGLPANQNPPSVFNTGVRVYQRSAENQIGNLNITKAPLKITSGDGGANTSPLAVLYLQLSQSDTDTAWENYF